MRETEDEAIEVIAIGNTTVWIADNSEGEVRDSEGRRK
jgi:hypothetical protein